MSKFTSFQFLLGSLTTDELVAIYKGDTPGYLEDKMEQLGIYQTEQDVIDLINIYLPTSKKFIWKRSVEVPTTPTGDDPTGGSYGDWQDSPYESDGTKDSLWVSTGEFVMGALIGVWSDPIRWTGEQGITTKVLYAKHTSPSNPPSPPVGNNPEDDGPPYNWFISKSGIADYTNRENVYIWESRGEFIEDELIGDWSTPVYIENPALPTTKNIYKRAATQPDAPTDVDPVIDTYGEWREAPHPSESEGDRLWISTAVLKGNTTKSLEVTWSEPTIIDGDSHSYYYKQVFKVGTSAPSSPPDSININTLKGEGWYKDPQDSWNDYEGTVTKTTILYVSIVLVKVEYGVESKEGDWSTPAPWTGVGGEDGVPGDSAEAIIPAFPSIILSEDENGNEVPNIDPIPVVVSIYGLTGDLTVSSSDLDGGSTVPDDYLVSDGKVEFSIPYTDITSFPATIDLSAEGKSVSMVIPTPAKIENPISIQLSNDNHTFSVPSSGVIEVEDYPAGNCIIEVFRGTNKLEYANPITNSNQYTIQEISAVDITITPDMEGTDRVLKPSSFAGEKNARVTFEVIVPSWKDHTVQRVFHKQISYGKASHLPDYEATILVLNNQVSQLETDKEELEIQILNVRDTLDNTSMLQGLVTQALSSNPKYFRDVLNVAEKSS